ncbi:uncharacterized protein TNCV_3678501 [Trichonephila clavipes]|nr:uncharacterized protein TNCV_3678501 [Trichonephila clavipes]
MWFPHIRHRQRVMNMNRYTKVKLVDIDIIYRIANGNGRTAARLFGERYPTRRQPNHQTFARGHQNLAEHGSFRATIESTGWPRTARTPIFEEGVLHAVNPNPGSGIRVLAVATPGIFEHVRHSMLHRYRACIHANGHYFEHLL